MATHDIAGAAAEGHSKAAGRMANARDAGPPPGLQIESMAGKLAELAEMMRQMAEGSKAPSPVSPVVERQEAASATGSSESVTAGGLDAVRRPQAPAVKRTTPDAASSSDNFSELLERYLGAPPAPAPGRSATAAPLPDFSPRAAPAAPAPRNAAPPAVTTAALPLQEGPEALQQAPATPPPSRAEQPGAQPEPAARADFDKMVAAMRQMTEARAKLAAEERLGERVAEPPAEQRTAAATAQPVVSEESKPAAAGLRTPAAFQAAKNKSLEATGMEQASTASAGPAPAPEGAGAGATQTGAPEDPRSLLESFRSFARKKQSGADDREPKLAAQPVEAQPAGSRPLSRPVVRMNATGAPGALPPAGARRSGLPLRRMMAAAGIAVAVIGAGGYAYNLRKGDARATFADASQDGRGRAGGTESGISRDELAGLRRAIAELKAGIDDLNLSAAATTADLQARLERLELAAGTRDQSAATGRPAAQAKAADARTQPSPVAAAGQPFTLQTPLYLGANAPSPETTGSIRPRGAASPNAYVLREVYDGSAVVESGAGKRKISVGDVLPGAGKVQAIEMRDRRWVVVTANAIIGADAR